MDDICKLLDWMKANPRTKVAIGYSDDLEAFELRVKDTSRPGIESGASFVFYTKAADKFLDVLLGGAMDAM